jgi:DNA-binding transcriptional MerR regulator
MDARQIPNKLFFKIGEVCEITDTQPYVLRYWESEFPALAPAKNSSGQRIYRRKDIETVLRIKQLLYEEGFTIAGAKKRLESEAGGKGATPQAMASLPETVVADVPEAVASVAQAEAAAASSADETRAVLRELREELRGILTLLGKGERKGN